MNKLLVLLLAVLVLRIGNPYAELTYQEGHWQLDGYIIEHMLGQKVMELPPNATLIDLNGNSLYYDGTYYYEPSYYVSRGSDNHLGLNFGPPYLVVSPEVMRPKEPLWIVGRTPARKAAIDPSGKDYRELTGVRIIATKGRMNTELTLIKKGSGYICREDGRYFETMPTDEELIKLYHK